MYLMVPAHQNLLSLLAHNFMASPLDQSCDRHIPPVPSNIWTPLDTDILELSTFCWFGADTLSVVLTLLQEGKKPSWTLHIPCLILQGPLLWGTGGICRTDIPLRSPWSTWEFDRQESGPRPHSTVNAFLKTGASIAAFTKSAPGLRALNLWHEWYWWSVFCLAH